VITGLLAWDMGCRRTQAEVSSEMENDVGTTEDVRVQSQRDVA